MICPFKPPRFWPTVKTVLALLAIAIFLANLFSCAPKRAVCERNYGPCGEPAVTRVIERVDTTIVRPAAIVHDTLRETITAQDTVRVVDSSGRSELSYWRNRAGQLEARCKALPDTVTVTQERIKVVRTPAEPVQRPWWEPFKNLIWAVLVGGLAFFVVWRIFRG